ncbi:hypothetical protein IAE39_000348 [Pseudomonas sp. S37]|uniref:hypothetical protein n=1 Tax=Pseudomonas sp. S37 TaxID=2767449 RepID=UPI0019133C0E|nr:hypothetical protein [Pseudomonas sp. S37]MBK4992174.1 hypothetical protein [Pseudomonas sp. S37]
MFGCLRDAELNKDLADAAEKHPMALFTRAILDLTGDLAGSPTPEQVCVAFRQLLEAASDRYADDSDIV